MVDDLRSVGHSVAEFWRDLSAVGVQALGLAILFHLTTPFLRARSWFNIARAAFPRQRLRYRSVAGAYLAGQGVNMIVPARAGDVLKLVMVHRRLPDPNYPTLTATLFLETSFDLVTGGALIGYAATQGVLPSLPQLPSLPAFELSLVARHPWPAAIAAGILVLGVAGALFWLTRRVRAFWGRVRQGLVILGDRWHYVRAVLFWQVVELTMRTISVVFFLEAFGIPATLENALLVLAVNAIASTIPFAPGGVGAKQALLAFAFAGTAAQAQVLSFSVGMQVVLVVVNVLLGFAVILAVFRSLGWRSAVGGQKQGEPKQPARPPRVV